MGANLPVTIIGTGSYLPQEVLANEHFVSYLDTSDEWILARTGIRERRRAASHESTSTLAADAARAAIQNAGIRPADVDLILCATATGDCPFPATATFIQAALGVPNIPAFDISAACAGYLHGLIVAGSLLSSGTCRRALVIGAETLTRFADPEDRGTVVLFGDAAGAAICERSSDPRRGILYHDMGCDGTRADLICLPAGGSRLPASQRTVDERLHYMRMRGREVYKFAVLKMQDLIDHALREVGLAASDLKLIIPHQSNLRIIESVRERLGLPPEKISVNIDWMGNTSAASVAVALDDHRRDGTLKEGDHVLMVALGAGLTWSTIIMRL